MTSVVAVDLTLTYPPLFFSIGTVRRPPEVGAATTDNARVTFASADDAFVACDAEDVACGPPLMSWVESHYCVLDYGAVARYLLGNHRLYGVLMELWGQVQSRFGTSATITLEVSHDAEAPEYSRLYAMIITAQSSDEALAQLDALQESWWLDKMPVTAGRFNIGIRHLV
jgi:hypothetical protein